MAYDELKRIADSRKGTALEVMIVRIIEKTVARGELNNLVWIFDKLFDYDDLSDGDKKKIITLNYKL